MENDKIHDEKGKFVAGHNVGRPKGSGNKKLNVMREKFQQLLDGYPVQQMQADLMEMEAGERLRLIVAMGDFFLPKLNRVDNSLSFGSDTIIVLPPPLVPPLPDPLPLCPADISPVGENIADSVEFTDEKNDNRPIESENI